MNLTLILALLVILVLVAALAVRAIGGNITLVEDWTKAWKWYSTYALLFVGALPDVFNALLAGDYLSGTPVSEEFTWWVRAAAGATFVLRSLRQVKPPPAPTFDGSPKA